jgi:hypothetical protein
MPVQPERAHSAIVTERLPIEYFGQPAQAQPALQVHLKPVLSAGELSSPLSRVRLKHCRFDLRCRLDNRRRVTNISEPPRGPIVVARNIEQRSVRRRGAAPVANQLIRPSANQVSLPAGHHELTSLVMHGCRKSDHSRPLIGRQFVYFQRWVECVTDEDRMTELRALIQKPNQTVLHQERKFARPRRGLNQYLVTMRQHVRHPSAPTVFDVIMDRMIVPARRLECKEQRLGHGPARNDEPFAKHEIIEPTSLVATMFRRVERRRHDRRTPYW